jgi:CO/xanthine dehydrogenase FAD-binding subunit
MSICNSYLVPGSIQDATAILVTYGLDARIIAGGTDLLLEIQQGGVPKPAVLVDITRIDECKQIQIRGERLFIGSVVPLSDIGTSLLVFQHARALHEAVLLIGGPQVRNMATLGGNVAHSLPAADGSVALSCLDAQVEIASKSGLSCIPLEDIFKSPGENTLMPDQFITGFYVPLGSQGTTSGFKRVMRPQGVALPILNMAILLQRVDEVIADVHVAVGPAGISPFRVRPVENYLTGRQKTINDMRIAIDVLIENTKFRTSKYRATREYRSHLAENLFLDLIDLCWNRVKE